MPTKPDTTSAKGGSASGGKPSTAKTPRKPRAAAVKKSVAEHAPVKHHEPVKHAEAVLEAAPVKHEAAVTHMPKGRYVFATGRRKTSVANVRLFEGKGETLVNKKPLEKFFLYGYYQEEVIKPFEVTGLLNKYHFTAHINGGGPHSQAGALRHGIAIALSGISEDVRKVLKKNGFLTRDDRKKERKKPGLKRARRSPQWAKR